METVIGYIESFFARFTPEQVLTFFIVDAIGVMIFHYFGIGKDSKKK